MGTPQIKLPMKSLLQHTLILHTCTQDLNKKLLRDNGRCNAAKKKLAHVPAVSYISLFHLFKLAMSGLQMIFPIGTNYIYTAI